MSAVKDDSISVLKEGKFGTVCVSGMFGITPFFLTLLTRECIYNKKIIKLLTTWRKENLVWIPSETNITNEGTKNWLLSAVIEKGDRLLFLIKVENDYIGQVGLNKYDNVSKTYELDSIIRGKNAHKGIMSEALKMLMRWGKEMFQIRRFTVQTSSNNERALRLYERLGFKEFERKPVIRKKTKSGEKWELAPIGYAGTIERYRIHLHYI